MDLSTLRLRVHHGVEGSALWRRMKRLSSVRFCHALDRSGLFTNVFSDEERMTDVIQVMEDGITTIRKLEGGDPKMRLENFLSMFVSNGFYLYISRLSYFGQLVSIIAADR
jgi:hypothetical protein